jgi:membrane-associated phospholipid phosphatase
MSSTGDRHPDSQEGGHVPALARVAAIGVTLVVVAFATDRWVHEQVSFPRVYEEDWGRLLRVMGYWPTWLLASVALVLGDWPRRVTGGIRHAIERGGLLLASVTASGVAGELLKLVLRRERPGVSDALYSFRPWSDRPLQSGGLAMPSTHAIVAFGAAVMLARLFPRAWPVWYGLAVGCGLTRILAGAHYLSDVIVAALVAWIVGALIWRAAAKRSGTAGAGALS